MHFEAGCGFLWSNEARASSSYAMANGRTFIWMFNDESNQSQSELGGYALSYSVVFYLNVNVGVSTFLMFVGCSLTLHVSSRIQIPFFFKLESLEVRLF